MPQQQRGCANNFQKRLAASVATGLVTSAVLVVLAFPSLRIRVLPSRNNPMFVSGAARNATVESEVGSDTANNVAELHRMEQRLRELELELRRPEQSHAMQRYEELRQERCPGPPGKEPPGVQFILRLQNAANCSNARFLVPERGMLFGSGDGGMGFSAEMGPAMWFLGVAICSGRIYAKDTDPENELLRNVSSVFAPLSTCETPPVDVLRRARVGASSANIFTSKEQVLRQRGVWITLEGVHLMSQYFTGFAMPAETYKAAAAMFFLRLTDHARHRVESALKASLPDDFDPERAISLPVHGANDKCGWLVGEGGGWSGCHSFEKLMNLCNLIRQYDPKIRDIILTSDNRSILDAGRAWGNKSGWRFIFNDADQVGRGSGRSSFVRSDTLTMLTTLHMTLRGKYFVLNRNSDWHELISILVESGGCSFVRDPMSIYLDQQENGKFMLCGARNRGDPTSICYSRPAR